MIELRWLDREVQNLHPATNVYGGRPRETVLQYRVQDPNTHGPVVWQDVPVVKEQPSMAELQARATSNPSWPSSNPYAAPYDGGYAE